jgi:protein-S-isoprenylcysteine O-methyltransferase Ste14
VGRSRASSTIQFSDPVSIVRWLDNGIFGHRCLRAWSPSIQAGQDHGQPDKAQSSSALVQTGIYQHTRNPMYLGFLLILIGLAIFTANLVAFLTLPAFVLYMNQFQIKPEERALTSIFGDEFRAYCSSVRRWI